MPATRILPGLFLSALAAFAAFAGPARAGGEAEGARAVFAGRRDSVIGLKLVISSRTTVSGREVDRSETTREIKATLIDPSGLAVFSLGASNPEASFLRAMGAPDEVKIESEVTELTMRLADGTEMPARVVIRDRDLDLGFVRPVEAPEEPLPAIDTARGVTAGVLDRLVVVGRTGSEAGWVPWVALDRVSAVVERPRTFYLAANAAAALGCPVFTVEGGLVGIFLLRESPVPGAEGQLMDSLFGGMLSMGVFPVVVPATEIAALVEHIPPAE